MSNEASRDPRRWFSHFNVSLNVPAMRKRKVSPTDIDALIHNRRTGRVLVLEGKPLGWEPSLYDGQMEAMYALLSIRCSVYLVRADWPQGSQGPVLSAAEARVATRPEHIEIADIRGWKRGKRSTLEWKRMTYDEFLKWLAEGWD